MLAHIKGKEPIAPTTTLGKNISVLGAIALQGFLGCMTIEGSTDSDV
jgi:hypothetical protein